jgi:hypothetical protein
MLKELIRLANHLDDKGLVKEADYLDRIIKVESSKVAGNFVSKVRSVLGLTSNEVSDCARGTARSMVTQKPDERISNVKCTRKDYEFSAPEEIKTQIIVALKDMADKDASANGVLVKYIKDLGNKKLLTAKIVGPTSGIFNAILEKTPAAIPIYIVNSLIAAGANIGGVAFDKAEKSRDKAIAEGFGERVNRQGDII